MCIIFSCVYSSSSNKAMIRRAGKTCKHMLYISMVTDSLTLSMSLSLLDLNPPR